LEDEKGGGKEGQQCQEVRNGSGGETESTASKKSKGMHRKSGKSTWGHKGGDLNREKTELNW